MDKSGSLYGITEVGGPTGSGVIFRLKPTAYGRWQETILYSIPGGNKGSGPVGGVVIGKGGVLYGTTSAGGSTGCGVIYKLAPAGRDKWKYTAQHRDWQRGCIRLDRGGSSSTAKETCTAPPPPAAPTKSASPSNSRLSSADASALIARPITVCYRYFDI